MVHYQKAVARDLSGEYCGKIVEVSTKLNEYYNPKYSNSTPEVLEITVQLTDPETLDAIMHTEKFVSPIVGDNGLFSQLLEVYGHEAQDSGDFPVEKLVDLPLTLLMGKNKKGYNTIERASKLQVVEVADPTPEFLKD